MSQKNTNHKDRRKFLRTSLKMGAMLPFLGPSLPKLSNKEKGLPKPSPHPLNILILGGTSFLGPHQIAYALNRGHSISIFTRGRTEPTIHKKLFKKVEHLVGDRANNLEALKERKWDAVIDNSGHRAQWTKDSAELLKDNVPLYLYTFPRPASTTPIWAQTSKRKPSLYSKCLMASTKSSPSNMATAS